MAAMMPGMRLPHIRSFHYLPGKIKGLWKAFHGRSERSSSGNGVVLDGVSGAQHFGLVRPGMEVDNLPLH